MKMLNLIRVENFSNKSKSITSFQRFWTIRKLVSAYYVLSLMSREFLVAVIAGLRLNTKSE